MSAPHALSENSLEEELRLCLEKLSPRKELSISCDRRSLMDSPTGNSSPGCEVSTGSHYHRSPKRLTPRGFSEKMGAWGAVSKPQRPHRQASKGAIRSYTADESTFKDLVYEHTSMPSPSPSLALDLTAQPRSPLTPHDSSDSSMCDMTQQTSSPATPHSIQSSTESPLSSPHGGYFENGANRISLQLPSSSEQAIPICLMIAHTSNPCPRPYHYSGHNSNLLRQSDGMGSMPHTGQDLEMSPRSYEKQLSLERWMLLASSAMI